LREPDCCLFINLTIFRHKKCLPDYKLVGLNKYDRS
jgi:hypothetical protein